MADPGGAYGPCRSIWIGGYDVALSCAQGWPHRGPHRNDIGTTWDAEPPLTCADCGSRRWNDQTVMWLPLYGGDHRQPYCAEACARDHR